MADPRRVLLCCLLAGVALPARAVVQAGTDTHGGAVSGARILHVTSLADSGPGTLRELANEKGPRVVVFDVGGTITLESDLRIASPKLTIAGQTAPSPITLKGESVRVRTQDVVIQHIALRPGAGRDAKENANNRDAITIGGGREPAVDIRVENISASWSVDEVIDISGPETRNITVRNSIVADALNRAGNPRGRHSMGMLINDGAQGVEIEGNLFANNMFRNPVMARGVSAYVAGNAILNPGRNSIHFYGAKGRKPMLASVGPNYVEKGSDTSRTMTAVQIPLDMTTGAADATIFLDKNEGPYGPDSALTNFGGFPLASSPPVTPRQHWDMPRDLKAYALRYAGSWPGKRDAVDRRILEAAARKQGRIIDDPSEAGGWDDAPMTHRVADVPSTPFSPSGVDRLTRVEAWLCLLHFEIGGPATPDCPRNAGDYRRALALNTRQ